MPQPLQLRSPGVDWYGANRQRGCYVKVQLSIDRFEGDKKQVAVLVADDGTQINSPKALLPEGARAGDVLTLTIKRGVQATKKVAQEPRTVQDELKKTGDV
jgi:hypothetical protein